MADQTQWQQPTENIQNDTEKMKRAASSLWRTASGHGSCDWCRNQAQDIGKAVKNGNFLSHVNMSAWHWKVTTLKQ